MAKRDAQNQEKILDLAKSLYEKDKDHWETLVYKKARADLKFLSDDDGAQWNSAEYERRQSTGRVTLQIDYLKQFVNQVVNDIRKQERIADVVPVGSKGSKETANALKGLLKKIQYDSNAEEVYSTAVQSQVKCSIGFIKIDHDFQDETDPENDKQVITLRRVVNPFVIYLDSESIDLNGKDAQHCTEIESMSQKEFQRRWPDAEISDFEKRGDKNARIGKDDNISVAHFEIMETEEETLLDDNGKPFRTIRKPRVMRYILSGNSVLESSESPFKFISTVPVYGEEAWEDGERKIHSLIRKSKQSQAQYNLMQSIKTDMLLNNTRANAIVPEGSIEEWAEDWKNPDKAMALRYSPFDAEGKPLPPPQILMPPQISQGFIEAAESSINDIRSTVGIYQANMGMPGNEVSGKAIDSRKIEGDNQTYHFGDNAMHSIEQACRVMLSGVGVIYDTPRIEQIINEEEEPELLGFNGAMVDGQEVLHNIAEGSYDVRVTVGASFSSQRQEAEEFLRETISGNPQMMGVLGDLLFKYADFAGADQMAARMQKLLPPQLQDQQNGQDQQVMALMAQLQQAQGIIQQLKAALEDKHQDQQIKMAAVQAKMQDSQAKHAVAATKTLADSALQNRALDLQEQKQAGDIIMDAAEFHQNNVIDRMNRIERQTLPHNNAGNPPANQGGGI